MSLIHLPELRLKFWAMSPTQKNKTIVTAQIYLTPNIRETLILTFLSQKLLILKKTHPDF